MENNNQRALCQQLWAENKYLVLSHSSNIYKDIRQYLKQEVVEVSHVQELIDRACQIPEHRGQVCNAFQHIWGYFKKQGERWNKLIKNPGASNSGLETNTSS